MRGINVLKRFLAVAVVVALFSTNVLATNVFAAELDFNDDHNNVIDQIYYSLFGDGFEFNPNQGSNVSQTIIQDNWQLEFLSAVAVIGSSFTTSVQPNHFVEFTDVGIYTIFSLQDLSGQIDLSIDTAHLLTDGFSDPARAERSGLSFGHILPAHFDTESGTTYFVVKHYATVEEIGDSFSLNIAIDHILSDMRY